MKYKIEITKFEDNPNYEEERKDWENRNRYSNGCPPPPNRLNQKNALSCELTEEEFKAVKSEVLKTFQ